MAVLGSANVSCSDARDRRGENLRSQLESLLAETASACQCRERSTFDNLIGGRPELVLFGAGGLGRKVLAKLRSAGIEPLAFADNKLAGQVRDGVQVLTPLEAAGKFGKSATFVVTIWASWADTMREQVEALRAFGCQSIVSFIPLLWKFPDLLPHTQIDLPSRVLNQRNEILRCFDLWSDEDSRREFVSQLRWRILGDFESLNPPIPNQYWQKDLISLKRDAIFVDAGAFDGDTIAQFVSFTKGQFRAVYAFEPDSQNLHALRERLRAMPGNIRARIIVSQAAVAEKECELSFRGGAGASSSPGTGTETVHCVALDHALPEAPDFIKYDIEGFELLGLTGTRQLIANTRPALAVCAYHIQDHLWRIPQLIHSFNQGYHYFLRSHGQIWETVCYAIPAKKAH